ncbi:hypothetical protein Tco_0411219 [Tanacetum coccineum]
MAKKAESNNGLNMNYGQKEIRLIWNNVQRINKQNQFVPAAVLTRTGKIVNTAKASGTKNVSTARQSFNNQAVLTSTAMKVNTLELLGGKGKLLLSPQQVVIGDHKDTTSTMSPNTMVDPVLEIDYPHRALKNKGIVDSGCSRHMTGNKAYLAEFQDFNGGPVAFGGSKVYITVSTDSAKLVPLGKVCTAIETLKKNTAKGTKVLNWKRIPLKIMVPNPNSIEMGMQSFMRFIDFLTRCSLSCSYCTITAKVLGKPVSILKASIRSDLLFDDANGIDFLPNQVIFDAIQLMRIRSERWMKSVSLKQRLARKEILKETMVQQRVVSKQGRKFAKGKPSVHKDPLFDEIPEDSLDYMETEDAQDVGRIRDVVDEEKENDEDVLSKATRRVGGKEEKKRLDEEEATKDALIRNYDDIKA